MKATVSDTGAFTIPEAVRDELGLVPGTILEMTAEEGRLVAIKVATPDETASDSSILVPDSGS